MLASAFSGVVVPAKAATSCLPATSTTSDWITLSSIGYGSRPPFLARSSIWFEIGLLVVRPLTSGMSPAAEMIFAAFGGHHELQELTASLGCFEAFITENPSPGY